METSRTNECEGGRGWNQGTHCTFPQAQLQVPFKKKKKHQQLHILNAKQKGNRCAKDTKNKLPGHHLGYTIYKNTSNTKRCIDWSEKIHVNYSIIVHLRKTSTNEFNNMCVIFLCKSRRCKTNPHSCSPNCSEAYQRDCDPHKISQHTPV